MRTSKAIWFILLLLLLLMIFLSSCSQPSTIVAGTPTTPPQEYALGPFIPVGDKTERTVATTTEVVRNCVEHRGTVIKESSRSTTSSHSVEWSVGGRTGVGATIGEGVIPGGIDLTSSIALTTGKRDIESVTTGNGWQLPSPPGEITTYFVEWKEVWQPGYIEVRVGNEVLYKIDTLIRLEVNSQIVDENSEPCVDNGYDQTETQVRHNNNQEGGNAIVATTNIFSVEDAEQMPLGPLPDCNYSLPRQFTLYYDETGTGGVRKTWDISELPAGIIIADADVAQIDSKVIGQMVLFMVPTDQVNTLTLTDGAFLIVSPENAEGILRLRERNLECRGLPVQLIRFPTTEIVPTPQPQPSSGFVPQTPEEAASLFGGPPASAWKRCPGEPVGCWTFSLLGTSYRLSVPDNCLRPDGSIDGWRYQGGYPDEPDEIEGATKIWNNIESAAIRCH